MTPASSPRVLAAFAGTIAAILLTMSAATGQVRLAHIFGDHMVLQCDKPVRIWGHGPQGSEVQVRFGKQTVTGRIDAQGQFTLTLAAMPATAKGRDLVVTGQGGGPTLRDVVVGEVWVCGGQSNMEWKLRSSVDADLEIPSANFPDVRFMRVPKIAHPEVQTDFPVDPANRKEGHWQLCIAPQVGECTAVGYYFARRLHRRLKVPVGVIDTSWGGTMAQHWVPNSTLAKIPAMKTYLDDFAQRWSAWKDGGGADGARKRLAAATKAWQVKRDAALAAGKRAPGRPNARSFANPAEGRQPSGMWNGMIAPIARFSVRGVLFYQGENNSFGESWKPFPRTFPAIIADWRKAFGSPNLPFGLIQIAGWSTRRSMTYDMNHHTNIVREVQFQTWQQTPHTGLVVTFDTNSNSSIHPARKAPVGDRSARWALAEVYKVGGKKPLEWHGPVYKSMAIETNKIRIQFEASTARGLRLDKNSDVGFFIAGADRTFHHARARIEKGQTLVVWSEKVKSPTAVRYGWSNLPLGGLMNGRELPAFPFRTDDWPLVPHQSKGAYEVGK